MQSWYSPAPLDPNEPGDRFRHHPQLRFVPPQSAQTQSGSLHGQVVRHQRFGNQGTHIGTGTESNEAGMDKDSVPNKDCQVINDLICDAPGKILNVVK